MTFKRKILRKQKCDWSCFRHKFLKGNHKAHFTTCRWHIKTYCNKVGTKMEIFICHKLGHELLVKPSSSFPALKLKFLKDTNKCLQLTDGDIGHQNR